MTPRSNRGKAWEKILERWNEHYRCDRTAVVFRMPPPVKVLTPVRRGQFRACWEGKGPPDYSGVSVAHGAVCFDAKDCDSYRMPLSAIHEHQARDLEAFAYNGGTSFIAMRMGGVGYVVRWSTMGPMYWRWLDGNTKRGEASVTASHGTRMEHPGDWMSAL